MSNKKLPWEYTPEFTKTDKVENTYSRGQKNPWWMIVGLGALGSLILLYQSFKKIDVKSTILTILFFSISLFFVEHFAIKTGHWVYNNSKVLGIYFFGIPLEEILIYYFFPPLSVILFFEYVNNKRNK